MTRLDHDANVAPWLELAHDRELTVRFCELDGECRLDLDHLRSLLSERTRVVAFPWASNAVGTVTPGRRDRRARARGGRARVGRRGALRAAPPDRRRGRRRDVLLCSPYKFFGPHLGLAFGRRELLERWRPYKVRPAPDAPARPPARDGHARPRAARRLRRGGRVPRVGRLGLRPPRTRRALGQRFLDGLPDGWTLHGPPTMEGRVPTFAITSAAESPAGRRAQARRGRLRGLARRLLRASRSSRPRPAGRRASASASSTRTPRTRSTGCSALERLAGRRRGRPMRRSRRSSDVRDPGPRARDVAADRADVADPITLARGESYHTRRPTRRVASHRSLERKLGAKPGARSSSSSPRARARRAAVKATLAPADGLWIAWPKKASKLETDLDFAAVQAGGPRRRPRRQQELRDRRRLAGAAVRLPPRRPVAVTAGHTGRDRRRTHAYASAMAHRANARPRSLVWATDIDVLAVDRVVERRDGYLVVRSPSHPAFYWGNLLLFHDPPAAGDGARWEALFEEAFGDEPGVRHARSRGIASTARSARRARSSSPGATTSRRPSAWWPSRPACAPPAREPRGRRPRARPAPADGDLWDGSSSSRSPVARGARRAGASGLLPRAAGRPARAVPRRTRRLVRRARPGRAEGRRRAAASW